MSFCRAKAVVLAALCALAVLAGSSAQAHPGDTPTVPISNRPIYPAEYRGDVRALPPLPAPDHYHVLNDYEGPPDRKPPAGDQTGLFPLQPEAALAAMPAATTFAGLSFNTVISGSFAGAGYPPDTNGDVGLTYYIQSVNDAYAIYNKTTGAQVAAFTENQLWSGAGTGTQCDAHNTGDPVVLYDGLADRWILTNFAFSFNGSGIPVAPFYQCIAVSKTSDPVAGGWWLYAVRMDPGTAGAPPAGTLNDYGKFGLDANCLYMGANGFTINSSTGASAYVGVPFAAFDRTTLFSGAALTSTNSSVGFLSGGTFSTFPANRLGTSSDSIPAAGTPEYFVAESQSIYAFEVRKFQQGATACGTGSSLGAVTNVSQTSYPYSGSAYIPQSGTTTTLDSLEDRVMNKVQYRKIGAAESLWVVHTTGSSASTAKIQWAQLNVSGGTISTTPLQQQIYAPDSTVFRWMPSLAVDGNGNMAVGYSTSSSSTFPSIAYSGRLASDTANQLPQTETVLVAGGGSQIFNCGGAGCYRWGDYSSMSIDPADDCTFWYTSQYYDTQANGSGGNWQTRIGKFKFPTCSSKTAQTISFTSSAPANAKLLDSPYVVTATATSGLAVTLTIDASATSVCSLSGSSSGSQVSYLASGTCKIDANQSGNATYAAAPQVQQTFTVSKASQTVSFTSAAPASAKIGDAAYVVTATATSGLAVTLSIDATATSVCSLSGSASGSQVTYLATGTCKINANQGGNATYAAAAQVQQTFSVGKGSQTISFTSTAPASAKIGDAAYVVTATASSGLPVTLAIDASASSVCSLSGSVSGSNVTYLTPGTCKINANQAGNGNYNAATQAQQTFAIGKGSQTISFTSTAPASAKIGDAAYVVTATATSGLAVALTVDAASTSVCSLSGSTSGSSVTYLVPGTCTIDANQAGNGNYNAATQVQQTFAVGKGSQTITFTSTAPASAKFGDAAYVVTATASSGLAVALTVDAASTSVCSLSGSTSGSSVTYLVPGTCTIDANQAGNGNYNAATQVQQTFAVGKGSQTITFTSTAPASAKFGDAAYVVTATASSGLAVTLSVDAASTSVCALSGSASGSSVTYLSSGTCTIDANQAGNGSYNAAAQVQQTFTVGKASQTINFTSTAPASAKFGDAAYVVTATASSGLAVALSVDAASTGVCSLSGSASGSSVTYLSSGTCAIDANQAGNGSYTAATQAQQSFTVGKASQTIGFTSTAPAGAKFGDAAYVVTATASSGLAVALSVDAASTSVCSLSGSASGSSVTYLSSGTCAIDANQSGNGSYNAATQAQQSFTVAKASQTINFTSTAPASAKFGDAAYVVTATATSGLPVALSVDGASSSVCSLSGSTSGSSVTYLSSGDCAINASQAGNGSYEPAPASQQSFGVGKASQAIVFTSAAPAPATLGDAPYTVAATASSGLAAVLSIDPVSVSVCAIDGVDSGSHVSFIGAGTCTIDADQAGNASYAAAPQAQQSFTVTSGTPHLVFTVQPASIAAGSGLNPIAVAELDPLDNPVDDNETSIDFTVPACGGTALLGSATMIHGVATLTSPPRLYTPTVPASLQVTAQSGALSTLSTTFKVNPNSGIVFAEGFEACRP